MRESDEETGEGGGTHGGYFGITLRRAAIVKSQGVNPRPSGETPITAIENDVCIAGKIYISLIPAR